MVVMFELEIVNYRIERIRFFRPIDLIPGRIPS